MKTNDEYIKQVYSRIQQKNEKRNAAKKLAKNAVSCIMTVVCLSAVAVALPLIIRLTRANDPKFDGAESIPSETGSPENAPAMTVSINGVEIFDRENAENLAVFLESLESGHTSENGTDSGSENTDKAADAMLICINRYENTKKYTVYENTVSDASGHSYRLSCEEMAALESLISKALG